MMTVKELSQLYYLKKEIERDREKLEQLREQTMSLSVASDGMPHGSDKTSSKTANLVADIVDLQMIIEAKTIQGVHLEQQLRRYIDEIDDTQTRFIFKLRFIDCLTWGNVAINVGGGNTEDGVKKRCYRYLKDVPNVPK